MRTWWRLYSVNFIPLAIALVVLAGMLSVGSVGDIVSAVRKHATMSSAVVNPARQVAKPAELPLGGRTLLPNYRLVALYGSPDEPALGVLGEQPVAATLDRVKALAAEYQPQTQQKVMPALEIITTVAAAEATEDGDFSRERSIADLRPWIDAAEKAGVYVVLDLQPGHSDFLSQAKLYEPLLKRPHVGLALDPEWRLQPGQKHMEQIGSVGIAEVNQTAAWLADLTKQHDLPQKLLLLHQFRIDMLPDRAGLDTARSELAYLVQMDGHGSRQQKQETWAALLQDAPQGLRFGWKNFYDEDEAMLSPAETMQVSPQPWFVSYQ